MRVLSRRPSPNLPAAVGAVQGDIATGQGVSEAVRSVDVVAHCATNPTRKARQTDVEGTRRLLEAARVVGTGHFLYISIVGIDRVPYPYYRVKLEAEGIIVAAGVPFTIFRATQFHDLVLRFFGWSRRLPFIAVPRGFVFQPVETAEVAGRMVDLVAAGPTGRAPDMGGPEVRRIEDLARSFARATGRSERVVSVTIPGKVGKGFRAGYHTCPEHADGRVTWEQFLEGRFGERSESFS